MSVDAIVRQLKSGQKLGVRGIGFVGARSYDETATLDAPRHIEKKATAVKVTEEVFGLLNFYRVDKTAPGTGRDGWVLGYEVGGTTVATLNHNRPICVSPDYSGCLFSVYEHNGHYKCCHTAGAQNDGDVHVHALQAYAVLQNWVLVHEVPTRTDNLNGHNGSNINGCVTTVVVTRIGYHVGGNIVRSVRLRMNNQSQSIHRTRWTTLAGGAPVQD